MSAVCRIIHLHGGPSDGLSLAWQDSMGETREFGAVAPAAFSEYDYIYVPRTAGAGRVNHALVTDFVCPRSVKRRQWQDVWAACRAWLLAPCSYPLDTRHLQIPVRTPETSTQQR